MILCYFLQQNQQMDLVSISDRSNTDDIFLESVMGSGRCTNCNVENRKAVFEMHCNTSGGYKRHSLQNFDSVL